jgi:hypothetical protein
MIFLLVAGALIVGLPILAAILVSVASRLEDAERSLTGRAPGKLTAAARRLLSLRTSQGSGSGRSATGRSSSAGSHQASPVQPRMPAPRQATSDQDRTLTLPRS